MVHIQAELAATKLREALDNVVGEQHSIPAKSKLHVPIKHSNRAMNTFVGSVLRALAICNNKAAATKPMPHPIGQLGPAFPHRSPSASGLLPAMQ